MKKTTKFVAVMMAIIMLCGCLPAFAVQRKPVYVVIGDSIAAGTGLQSPEVAAYGAIVANTNFYEYKNYAVPGYTTGNLLELVQEDVDVREDLDRADIINISIGGNNFLLGNLPLLIIKGLVFKNFDSFDDIIVDLMKDFDEIIGEIKELNPDAIIIMQNLYNPRYDLLQDTYQEGVNRLNKAYADYLAENPGSYVLIDIESHFAGHEDWIASDSIHPNAQGHLEISKLVLAELYDLGYGMTTDPIVAETGEKQKPKQNTFELFLIGVKNIFLSIKNLLF